MSLELVRKLPYDHPYRYDGTLFGGPKLWTPSEISTSAWFDAYDEGTITESGGAVSQWDDKSGNANHATQGTGSLQPVTGTNVINGLNAIYSDGSNLLEIALDTWQNSNDIMVFMVLNADSPIVGNSEPIGNRSGPTSQEGFIARLTSTQIRHVYIGGGTLTGSDSISLDPTSERIVSFSQNGLDMTVSTFDGGTEVLSNFSYQQYVDSTSYLSLFKGGEKGGFFVGSIGEIIITSYADGVAKKNFINGYLAHKWGLEANLPVSHPYYTNPPTV